MDRTTIDAAIKAVLRQYAVKNRGSLAPFQLDRLVPSLVELFLAVDPPAEAAITPLWQRGLALESVLAAVLALHEMLLAEDAALANRVVARLPPVVTLYASLERTALLRDQEALREAVNQTLLAQQAESQRLTSLVGELSLPIVPIYDGILVLPLIGAIDAQRAAVMMDRLMHAIIDVRAHTIIMDMTGVPLIDTAIAKYLLATIQAAQLLGAEVIMVGINPEMAQTIVPLGITLDTLRTMSDLQAGIRYALRRRGLGIGPLGAQRPTSPAK